MGNLEDSQESVAQKIVRGSIVNIAASSITLVLGFGRSILLARLLLPEDFGTVALAMFYIGLITRLRGWGLDAAFIHQQRPEVSSIRTYFTLRTGLDLLTLGAILAAIPILALFYSDLFQFGWVVALLGITFFLGTLSQLQETFLLKNLAYSKMAITNIVASVVMTVIAPTLAWSGWGLWALVAEQSSGIIARFGLTWTIFRQWWPRLGWDKEHVRGLWQYGKPYFLAGNVAFLLNQFDDFWVGTALGQTALGYYSKAYEFARYPRRILANPLVTVFSPIFAQFQDDRARLSKAFFRAAYIISRTSFLVAGLFSVLVPEFIYFVIGQQWQPMLWTFRLMLLYTVIDPLLVLTENLMLGVGSPKELQRAHILQLVFFIPAVIIMAVAWGINGVALAADGMLLVGLGLYYKPLTKIVDFSSWKVIGWPTIATITSFCVTLIIEYLFIQPSISTLFFKLSVFASIFGITLLIVEKDDFLLGFSWMKRMIGFRLHG